MKKKLLSIFSLFTFLVYSQKEGNHEIKLNLVYTFDKLPEVSYEYILNNHNAIGLSLAFPIAESINQPVRFMLTPYYRVYFGKEKAKGFFIEANTTYLKQENHVVYFISNLPAGEVISSTNFGFGAAIGVKFLNKKGYIGELYGGFGHLFGDIDELIDDLYPRIGISLGKRF